MSKRFNISIEEILEVDKVSEEIEDKQETPSSEKVLDTVVAAAEKTEEEKIEKTPAETPPSEESDDEPVGDTPVEVSEDKTTVDGTPVEEEPAKTDETPAEEPAEEEEKPEEPEVKSDPEDASSMSDVADAIKEDEDNDVEVEVATEAAITLEEIAEELEASIDRGGMSESSAAVTDVAVRGICARVGIVPKESQEIAVESFKSPSRRIHNTKIAIETISGYILKLWDAFIQSIKRGIQWIKDFISGLFNDYSKFKNQIKDLKEAVNKLPNDKVDLTGKEFKEKTVIDNLKIKDSVDVLKAVDELKSFTKLYYALVEKQRAKQINNLRNIIETSTKGTVVPDVVLIQSIESFDIIKIGEFPGYLTPANCEAYVNKDILPGNIRFLAFYPSDVLDLRVEKDISAYNSVMKKAIFSFVVDLEANKKEIVTAPILDKSELTKLVSSIDVLCTEALSSKPIFDKFIREKTEIQIKLEYLIKEQNRQSLSSKVSSKLDQMAEREHEKKPSLNTVFAPIEAQFTLLKNTYENGSSHLSKLIHKTIKASMVYTQFCIKENVLAIPVKTP